MIRASSPSRAVVSRPPDSATSSVVSSDSAVSPSSLELREDGGEDTLREDEGEDTDTARGHWGEGEDDWLIWED